MFSNALRYCDKEFYKRTNLELILFLSTVSKVARLRVLYYTIFYIKNRLNFFLDSVKIIIVFNESEIINVKNPIEKIKFKSCLVGQVFAAGVNSYAT